MDFFYQSPNNHLNGDGCPKCNGGTKYTKEIFIEKAVKVHGNKYDYSLVNYINSGKKVIIKCSLHGEFEQTPEGHLVGHGCNLCAIEYKRNLFASSPENFIIKANEVHEGKYSYFSDYINNNIKISIFCDKHGVFKQTPGNHLAGKGCSKCSKSKNELKTGKFIKELLGDDLNIEHPKKFKADQFEVRKNIFVDYYFELQNKKYIVEYNGKQHYEQCWVITNEKFIKQQKRNEFLREMCIKEDINLIEIDGRKYTNNKIKKYLSEQFKELGIYNVEN